MGRLSEKNIFAEIQKQPAVIKILRDALMEKGTVTFIFAAHDKQHNNAGALKEYVEKQT